MATAHEKYWEHEQEVPSVGSEIIAFVCPQTVKGTPGVPTSSHYLPVTNDLGTSLDADRTEDDTRKSGTRSPKPSFSDRFPLGTVGVEANLYPPGSLLTNLDLLGFSLLDALVGQDGIIVNTQTAVNIDAVNSHDTLATEIDIVGTTTQWKVGMVAALRSNNANSAPANGIQRLLTVVTDIGGGNVRLKFEGGFPARPIASGTKDTIQGGVVRYPDDSVRFSSRLFSMYAKSGRSAVIAYDGTTGKGGVTLQTSGLLKLTADFVYTRLIRSAEDQVRGDATTAAFLTTDTVLRVPGARKFDVGAFVNLRRVTTSNAWVASAVASTEEKAEVTAVSTVNRTLTLTRGTTPVSATALTAVTSATQELNGTYDTSLVGGLPRILRLAFDNRRYIDIALVAGVARTATQVVAEINAAFKASPYYGQYTSSPFHGEIDWETVAVVDGTAVRLQSQAWGSQSRIQNIDTGVAATSAHALIFDLAFDLTPAEEIQIEPWLPTGTNSRTPILMREGLSYIDGGYIGETEASFELDNQIDKYDRRDNTQYAAGFVPGLNRTAATSFSAPAVGWTDEINARANANTTHVVNAQAGTGTGSTVGIHLVKTRFGSASKTGDNLQSMQWAAMPEEDTTRSIKEVIIALT